MKRMATAAAALILLGTAAMADPVFGTWKTEPGDDGNFAHVTISECGGKICESGLLTPLFCFSAFFIQRRCFQVFALLFEHLGL